MSRTPKIAWSFIQLALVALSSLSYIPLRLARKSPCCDQNGRSLWWFREMYEHPYSKFINHTTWYLVFLAVVFSSSFEDKFGTTATGLLSIDFVVIAFVVGLLLQEILEASRQGFYVYMSKWWNIVDTVIIIIFLVAETLWIFSWIYFHLKWKPEENAFILSDALYATSIVIAFFHLTHIFQIDSILGPLQLSLYRMLKDVWQFLLIFLLLYISFSTGVVKVYSYYVVAHLELQKHNMTVYQPSHPYDDYVEVLIGLFWLLLGVVDEEKIDVKDPAFVLTTYFGRMFMIVYVVCMVIVALNMLIAMMNNSFERIMENADVEWKFSRAQMWLEWIDKGNTMPVPLNVPYYILYAVIRCFRFFKRKCQCRHEQRENEQANRKRDKARNWKQRRQETIKNLVVKYLKHYYFGKQVKNAEMADNNADASDFKGKAPKDIQENISLLRRLVDSQAKELAEINKKIDSIVKEAPLKT